MKNNVIVVVILMLAGCFAFIPTVFAGHIEEPAQAEREGGSSIAGHDLTNGNGLHDSETGEREKADVNEPMVTAPECQWELIGARLYCLDV